MRKKVNRRIDRKIFKRTATRVRRANIVAGSMRGGIRLWLI